MHSNSNKCLISLGATFFGHPELYNGIVLRVSWPSVSLKAHLPQTEVQNLIESFSRHFIYFLVVKCVEICVERHDEKQHRSLYGDYSGHCNCFSRRYM